MGSVVDDDARRSPLTGAPLASLGLFCLRESCRASMSMEFASPRLGVRSEKGASSMDEEREDGEAEDECGEGGEGVKSGEGSVGGGGEGWDGGDSGVGSDAGVGSDGGGEGGERQFNRLQFCSLECSDACMLHGEPVLPPRPALSLLEGKKLQRYTSDVSGTLLERITARSQQTTAGAVVTVRPGTGEVALTTRLGARFSTLGGPGPLLRRGDKVCIDGLAALLAVGTVAALARMRGGDERPGARELLSECMSC